MRLLIASGIYPPDIGGPATYSQIIAREFSKKGINVSLICYSDKKQEDKENFKIIRILRKYNTLIRYWLYFWSLFKLAKDCDVIYAQGPLAAGLPAKWVSKILRKKFIIKIVGDYAWEQGVNQFGVEDLIENFQKKNKKYSWKVERIRKIQNIVVRTANKIIVPSEFLKKIVRGWRIDENKIKVIYNAGPRIKEIKERVKLKGDVIISAGRLERWKGMDMLIEIMPDLLKENPNFRLIIIGRGPEWENLKSQILELKLPNQVELIDKLPHEELMRYFRASNMFVLNTAYEGLPHIILEAMACGLPVITTNVCGNPEVVEHNETGLMFGRNTGMITSRDSYFRNLADAKYNNKKDLKDTILRLWKNKSLRDKFTESGYKTLEKFKLEDMINQTLEALKS